MESHQKNNGYSKEIQTEIFMMIFRLAASFQITTAVSNLFKTTTKQ
jgi:hypothetical protein